MVICMERNADLHMAQLMPLPLTVSCFRKIQIDFTFLVPADLGSLGKKAVKQKLLTIFNDIWHQHAVPQDFKNALIVHVFKKKGDRSVCDDYRGISLLSIPGKILGRIILNLSLIHI